MDCKHATKLLSDAEERELTARERFGLRFHVLICRACRIFQSQLQLFRHLLTDASPKMLAGVYASDVRLSEPRRQKIKALLRQAAQE